MPSNEIRIIGGQWRGRKLRFPPLAGLRPTPDRVRETLFNWLGQELVGRRTLDPFAGSGALSFEALSRGASFAVAVEREPALAASLRATAARLETSALEVHCADAFDQLARERRAFDVVFLDPPFAQGRQDELCKLLEDGGWLAPRAFIYLECAARGGRPPLPSAWETVRETRAGEVLAVLARRREPAGSERMVET